MQQRLCSAILLLQAVVLGLSTIALVQEIDTVTALAVGLGLAAACVLTAGLLRHQWAYALGWSIQAAAVALGFLVTPMFALGAVFLVLWVTAFRLGRTIDRDRAAAPADAPEAAD